MKFLYDAFTQIKDDPKQTVRTLRQYNADIAKAYILFSAADYANQTAAEYGYGVMPGLTSAATTMLWNTAFFGNELVLSTIERFLPDAVKDTVGLDAPEKGDLEQEDEVAANLAKPHAM